MVGDEDEKKNTTESKQSGTSNVMGKHVLDLCLSSAPLKTMTTTERRAAEKAPVIGQAEETSLSPKLDVKENDECVIGLMASLAEQRARAEREDRRWRGRTVTGFNVLSTGDGI